MSNLDAAFARVLDGETTPEETKAFLIESIGRMRDPGAIAAGARAMRARMIPVQAPEGAIDVCGTGGDGAHTLNISTAVGFVVAGAGVPVAKHGNRAMSSKCGAADVLEALGVKLTADVPTLERALREANIAFLFAQNHHPSMRHVAVARREIGQRTIFNLLGPLSNPARVKSQLMGVFSPDMVTPVAEALRELGAERAWVVHGAGGLDELATADGNLITLLDGSRLLERELEFFGSHTTDNDALRGGSAVENAAALRALLDGSSPNEAYRQSVELNAAAALELAGAAPDFGHAMMLARESLDEGLALAALEKLIAITSEAP
ncbi:MAG TPA: anthranilate phosphoribosyltransferase [Caulobacterales bacterium]|nr:anthranilate phosphoribosyltransferase [Caulobacterales bacterium]